MEEIPLDGNTQAYDHLIESTTAQVEEPKQIFTLKERAHNFLEACGWRFLVFLVVSQLACKGFLIQVVASIMLPLFRNRTDAATLQIYIMMCMIPWSIKPLIGLCSDYILLGGYNKRGWLVVGAAIGIVAALFLLLLGVSATTNPFVLVFCFIGINFEIALFDLLSEGKYAEIRRLNKHVGSDFTTVTQALQTLGSLGAVCMVGFMGDARNYLVLYILVLAFSVLPLWPTLLGWMPEERHESGKLVGLVDTHRFRQEWPKMLVVGICGLGGVSVSVLTTVVPAPAGPLIGLGAALVFLGATLYGTNKVFGQDAPLIPAVALYQVVTTLSQPLIGSELDYFYTATPECLPDGPHFSYAYYISYTGIVGTVLKLTGVAVYYVLLSRLRFRPVLLITTLLVSLAGLSDLMIVLRVNIWLGIPDHVAYMVGEAVLEPLLSTLNWIPVSALIVLAAPAGMESSCFAFLAGLSNFARMVSELSGSILIRFTSEVRVTEAARILRESVGCDFSSLWWLVLMCHISFPLIVGVMATWLVPDLEQDEQL